jgi:hypothetical protein
LEHTEAALAAPLGRALAGRLKLSRSSFHMMNNLLPAAGNRAGRMQGKRYASRKKTYARLKN